MPGLLGLEIVVNRARWEGAIDTRTFEREGIVNEAESDIGFKLPRLLRRAYAEVANGGFGPGAGLVSVDGG